MSWTRRFPIGAELAMGDGVHCRVWAPNRKKVMVVERQPGKPDPGRKQALTREPGGYFAGLVPFLRAGSLYSFQLDDEDLLLPDVASRFQPEGPHGPSQIVDPRSYAWKDTDYRGPWSTARVVYEMHIGTFTAEGTYRAAQRELPELRALGVTTLELMPVADFPGRFGWGYDGVDLWAPYHSYGPPDALREFIDSAHRLGLEVILDVVYNHLGPDGNYLKQFSPHYFSERYENEWGEPLNFDAEHSGPVREFFTSNARYWVEEFHFDGLRLDATQSLFDASDTHIIVDVTRAVNFAARAQNKAAYVVAENEPQHTRLVRPYNTGGFGCSALWNDDFHHTARVALTGRHEAYYHDYRGSPQELISALKWGYLYQGQNYSWQKKCRGTPALDLNARNFVSYLQNHDQVANSATGARLHELTSPAQLRAMTALMLLAPPTPMLFQGQEFASSAPFLYFADQKPELCEGLNRDRRKFLSQFPSIAHPDVADRLADASALETFERCKLNFAERVQHQTVYDLHRDLLQLRHTDPVFNQQRADVMHGAVLGSASFVLRWMMESGERLVLVNLGMDQAIDPAPEPLLACPEGSTWELVWSSEHPKYGGIGFGKVFDAGRWQLPAHSTHVFKAVPEDATD
ncbi:MAG TPA: malto-oligosyltrehalose trehalohydrolase, partial [Polyangiaceae bacterium]|nr:malto-oligosyltrehalose trehalohydrolase [Polyangiaceae bacterium]